MWQHFTGNLRRAVIEAAGTGEETGADVSVRDLLLGVAAVPESVGARLLGRLGLTPERLESRLALDDGSPREEGAERGLTPAARRLVEAAYEEAHGMGDGHIGTEHLLLALVRDSGEGAAGLQRAGVTLETVGEALMEAQTWRVSPPEGVGRPPDHRLRKRRAQRTALLKKGKQIAFLVPRLSQPFVPYVLRRRRTIADVYPFLRRLTKQRFYWDRLIECWVAAGHTEVAALLQEKGLSAAQFRLAEPLPALVAREFRPLDGTLEKLMLFQDAPDQTRLRSLFSKAFSPKAVESLRGQIQTITDGLLDAVADRGQVDVIAVLAFPLPALVIARLLGVPFDDDDQFKKWSDDFTRYIIGFQSLPQALETRRSLSDLSAFLRARIAVLRRAPEDNLLSRLIEAEEEGNRLTEDELVANALLLLAAGHETTTNLIGNGLLALLRHPEQKRLLQSDPKALPAAIEELLRFESPVQWTSRVAVRDVAVGGRTIKAGQRVMLGLGAANRDPVRFPNPDCLNLSRADGRHLAFGFGSHYCLGAALARLEGEIALGTLLRRFPNLRLQGGRVEYQDSFTLRALKSLPVMLREVA